MAPSQYYRTTTRAPDLSHINPNSRTTKYQRLLLLPNQPSGEHNLRHITLTGITPPVSSRVSYGWIYNIKTSFLPNRTRSRLREPREELGPSQQHLPCLSTSLLALKRNHIVSRPNCKNLLRQTPLRHSLHLLLNPQNLNDTGCSHNQDSMNSPRNSAIKTSRRRATHLHISIPFQVHRSKKRTTSICWDLRHSTHNQHLVHHSYHR